ncbi:hypothetical protein TNCV_4600431 [Trichonephila clavipes]|nr:hypothetical protein TNCV_4600431 [Trichonephila clavipes]
MIAHPHMACFEAKLMRKVPVVPSPSQVTTLKLAVLPSSAQFQVHHFGDKLLTLVGVFIGTTDLPGYAVHALDD